MDTQEGLHTWREWDSIYYAREGIFIIDPKGFPKDSPERMENERYTEEEFRKRLTFCEIGHRAERLPWEK